MRIRPLLVALLAVAAIVPVAAHAAIPFFGPIIPDAYNQCAASWGMVMIVVNNIISFLITLAIVFVAPLMIAYAGFLFVFNPVNAGGISKAKGILTNTIVGIVIALVGYLMVDAVMAVLYNPAAVGKTWSALIGSGGINPCLPLSGSLNQTIPGLNTTGVNASGTPTGISVTGAPGQFTFDPGIANQLPDASSNLSALLSCMVNKIPAGVGRISSISDSLITNGQKTFAQCAAGGCQHSANSCHYGGRLCLGKSYAVDFGDEQNASILTSAAKACGANYTGFEGNHLHASVGSSCGCN